MDLAKILIRVPAMNTNKIFGNHGVVSGWHENVNSPGAVLSY